MNNIPNHVAIIMDGNGRWAKSKGLPRTFGHKKGLDVAETIIDYSIKAGIKYLSLYVFSTENWKRSQAEVNALFTLAEKYLTRFEKFCRNRIKIVVSGERQGLPASLIEKIDYIQKRTADFDCICVNLCINYGSQTEIAQAAEKAALQGAITVESIRNNLYNPSLPSPDLVIRTGGQKRLSNFLLFQSAYAELYFCDTFWPNFSIDEYNSVLMEYADRTRTFGGIVDGQ